MRALEEAQLAEERALLSAPGSPGPGVIGKSKRKSVNLEPEAANAKSMPGSRRGSAGSGKKAEDELLAGLGGLRIGTVIGSGLGNGAVSAVTAPSNGFLWDEALDREMQSTSTVPLRTPPSAYSSLQTPYDTSPRTHQQHVSPANDPSQA